MPRPTPKLKQAILRGLRRRCPRCGDGAMFRRWFSMNIRCSVCELEFEGTPGDTWGFWILTDRAFLFVTLAALYLGFTPESWFVRAAFFFVVVGLLVATMPQRQGAFVAIDYIARTRWK